MSTDIDKIFNEFLLSMVKEGNVSLIQELRHRWKEYLGTPITTPQDHIGIDRNGEDTKKERIEVTVVNNGYAGEMISVRPNRLEWVIPKEKNEAIKQAIELILNDEPILKWPEGWKFSEEFPPMPPTLYTQQQVDAMCEKAFNDSRELVSRNMSRVFLYPTFEHYKTYKP